MAATDLMSDDAKLAPHRKAVADAIDTLSGFKDSVASPEATKVRNALMHLGRAHNELKPVQPATPQPVYGGYDY